MMKKIPRVFSVYTMLNAWTWNPAIFLMTFNFSLAFRTCQKQIRRDLTRSVSRVHNQMTCVHAFFLQQAHLLKKKEWCKNHNKIYIGKFWNLKHYAFKRLKMEFLKLQKVVFNASKFDYYYYLILFQMIAFMPSCLQLSASDCYENMIQLK